MPVDTVAERIMEPPIDLIAVVHRVASDPLLGPMMSAHDDEHLGLANLLNCNIEPSLRLRAVRFCEMLARLGDEARDALRLASDSPEWSRPAADTPSGYAMVVLDAGCRCCFEENCGIYGTASTRDEIMQQACEYIEYFRSNEETGYFVGVCALDHHYVEIVYNDIVGWL